MSKQKEWERRRLERLAKEAGKATAPPVKLVEDERPEPSAEVPQAPAEPESQPIQKLVTGIIGDREKSAPMREAIQEMKDSKLPAPFIASVQHPTTGEKVEVFKKIGELTALNEKLQKELADLKSWKEGALKVESWWQKIDNHVRNHPSLVAGQSVADEALRLLKERDALMMDPAEKFIPSDRDLMLNSDHIWKSFLATPAGKALTDPRLPNDYGRLIGVLEDRAKAAFTAGMEVGR